MAKDVKTLGAEGTSVDAMHLGLTSLEEFDRLVDCYCPLESATSREE